MLNQKPLNRILFIDIETTSQREKFADLTEKTQKLFLKRFKKEFADGIADPEDVYNTKAPIFAEFGRVLCISVGILWKNPQDDFYRMKIISFSNEDEKELLRSFIEHEKLKDIFSKLPGKFEKNLDNFWGMVGYNGKVFDFPFLSKRMIIKGFELPAMFDYAHLKPWEQTHIIDPKEAWTFGVFDGSVSLDLLCDAFSIPSSKDDIDGSQVKDIYWKEKDLPRIVKYCEKDVMALAQIYLRMKSMSDEIKLFEG